MKIYSLFGTWFLYQRLVLALMWLLQGSSVRNCCSCSGRGIDGSGGGCGIGGDGGCDLPKFAIVAAVVVVLLVGLLAPISITASVPK